MNDKFIWESRGDSTEGFRWPDKTNPKKGFAFSVICLALRMEETTSPETHDRVHILDEYQQLQTGFLLRLTFSSLIHIRITVHTYSPLILSSLLGSAQMKINYQHIFSSLQSPTNSFYTKLSPWEFHSDTDLSISCVQV